MSEEKILTVVLPIYNEADIIEKNIQKIDAVLTARQIAHDFVLVDDGSKDGTWDILSGLASQSDAITALKLSRNFGKEGAIFAGLDHATGHCVAVMDCDLQHPPEILADMYTLWAQNQYEIVEAVKADRGKEHVLYRWCANTFYWMMHKLSGLNLKNASDFRLMDRKVVEAILSMPEKRTFFRGMSSWVGYKRTQILFDVPPREGGGSKWSKLKLYRLAMDAISSYSSLPLQIVTMTGIIFLIFGILLAIHTLYQKFTGQALDGFTTVILLLIITGSIIMLGLGMIGSYIAKIYEEVKGRPRYIVSQLKKRK